MHTHLYLIPLAAMAAVWLAMVILDLRFGFMRATDRFSSRAAQFTAYASLGVFLLLLTFLVVGSSMRVPTKEQLAKTPFYQLFSLHAILIIFLFVWWLLTNRPNLLDYLNIQRRDLGKAILTGCAVGVGGWIFTIMMALLVGSILMASGLMPKNTTPPPMIAWLVTMPLWKRGIVVLSAMTVEEAFFRGWLQKRFGLIASTILFALAHVGLGQPFLLIGVGVISLVIGTVFYRTKNLIPGVIAHGIFDAVQLFVVIPVLYNFMGS
jgi:membrane protease YdiL (CAAX protease family)